MLDAVIMAGGDPDKDADLLAHAGNVPTKALIAHQGKTFLARIVSALLGSGRIERIVVVGLPAAHRPDFGPRVTHLPDQGGMVANARESIAHLLAEGRHPERIVVASSDIPLITPDIVNDTIDRCQPHDVDYCYNIVRQEVMERAFPGSGRTFIPLVEGRFAGGDLSLVKPSVLHVKQDILCDACHGDIPSMDRIKGVRFRMEFCIGCHREKNAGLDCWLACHN